MKEVSYLFENCDGKLWPGESLLIFGCCINYAPTLPSLDALVMVTHILIITLVRELYRLYVGLSLETICMLQQVQMWQEGSRA